MELKVQSYGFTEIIKLKELESENDRLKEIYAEGRLRADILKVSTGKKVKKQSQGQKMAKMISEERVIAISIVCKIFCVSEICYGYNEGSI